ncbi:MAG: 50S ribosomal protein L25 [Dehalococcoidales bacterium]|nr:50S ribosomal protein L25 [Dehalococcoidales bacterium]
MEELTLKATTREVLGKKTRFLRREGITPVHLFGHSVKSQALQCQTVELVPVIAQAGTTTLINLEVDAEKRSRKVLIREIQQDVFGNELLHVDFYQVRKTEKIKADIPIVLVGEAPALKLKGRMLLHPLSILSIECLPDNLPHEISVDLSSLEEVDQAIHVRDLNLGADVAVANDPDELVVKISEKAISKVVEEVAEAVAEEAPAEAEAEAETAAESPSE